MYGRRKPESLLWVRAKIYRYHSFEWGRAAQVHQTGPDPGKTTGFSTHTSVRLCTCVRLFNYLRNWQKVLIKPLYLLFLGQSSSNTTQRVFFLQDQRRRSVSQARVSADEAHWGQRQEKQEIGERKRENFTPMWISRGAKCLLSFINALMMFVSSASSLPVLASSQEVPQVFSKPSKQLVAWVCSF